jgi:hypothetical protein
MGVARIARPPPVPLPPAALPLHAKAKRGSTNVGGLSRTATLRQNLVGVLIDRHHRLELCKLLPVE